MKTKLILSLGMLTALAVGCSKELPTVNENAWIYDESLPVPIQFGSLSSEMATKAAITKLKSLAKKPIGVFAWDEGHDDSMETSAKSIFPDGFRRAQVRDINPDTGEDASLMFWEKDASSATKAYYPMSSKYNYSFYAYYTGTENIEGTISNDSYSVNIDFSSPFTDILWGKCSDSDLPYGETLPHLTYKENQIKGFNSRFSRAAARQETVDEGLYYPSIEFKHVCSAFSFYAKAEDDDSMTSEKLADLNEHVKIKSVEITNVPTSATLVVAAREEDNQGVFEPIESKSSVSMVINEDYEIKKGNDNVILSNSDRENQFFLPPGDYRDSRAILHCTLDGNPFDLPFDLKYTNEGEESTEFEAGKSYSFVVIFKTLEAIMLSVSLKEWEVVANTDVDIEN